jgi:hypothetical protein
VARLVTLVDLRDDGADTHGMSLSTRHEAELDDGRRLLLLDDRGWSSSLNAVAGSERDVWAFTSVADIEETSRVVVGPDEPFEGKSQQDMETDHWNHLAQILSQQGVAVDAGELKQLPHDVVLSERLLGRVAATGDG